MTEKLAVPEFERWRRLDQKQLAKHQKLIKIYNLTPFLYSQVCQPDNWIRYANQVGLLPSESVGVLNSGPVTKEVFEKVCLVEECNDLVTAEMIKKGYLEAIDTLLKTISEATPLNEVVRRAGLNTIVKRWKEKISCKQPNTVYVALLFVSWQYIDHVHQFLEYQKDPEQEFAELCDLKDDRVLKEKVKGNKEFKEEKFSSAVSSYSNGLCRSLYNYILYGNRALAQLKLHKYWEAMCDGCRCVILKPDWPKGQYRYAEAWYKLGQLDKAISVVQAAIELNRDETDLLDQKERFIKERQKRKRRSSKNAAKANKVHDQKSASCQTDSVFHFSVKETTQNGVTQVNADSGSDGPPPLVSSSDDDDSEDNHDIDCHTSNSLPIPRPVNTHEKSASERLYVTHKEVQILMKHGSEALLQAKPAKALQEYTDAQNAIGKLKHWSDLMKELDYVVLLYSVGTAHINMCTFKHIMEGLTWYESIMKIHDNVPFPLVYLGLGRAYHKQNRFSEALVPLRKGLTENRWQDTVYWPGTNTMIAESRQVLLKVAVEELMELCQYPPPPIAICKFDNCQNNHYKVAIYENDLDFKGYVVIRCVDHCTLAYHMDCWKYLKGKLKSSDKDILQGKCMTPDCGADIKAICVYDSGRELRQKVNEKPVHVSKEKKKTLKMKPSSQRKIARKRDKLAVRRQRKQEVREERERAAVMADKIVEEKKEAGSKTADRIHSQPAISGSGDATVINNQPKAIVAVLHHGPGGDGGDSCDLFVGSRQNHKPKNKKKKGGLKPTKVTMSLGEFVGDTVDDDASEADYVGLMGLDEDFDDYHRYSPALPNGYVDDLHQADPSETEDTIYSFFVDLLQKHGPTHITDPILKGELQALSEDARLMIEGTTSGLHMFLLQSPEFTVIDDFLCLTNETPSQTPTEAYSKNDFAPPQTDDTHADGVARNESVSRLRHSYDTESVSSESSFSSWHSTSKMTSSTAQLAPIQLDDVQTLALRSDSKNSQPYIDQETEMPCELSEYSSSEYFLPESVPAVPWYSGGGTNEYSDLEENDTPDFDENDAADLDKNHPLQTVDDPEDELSDDEYAFLVRNREFVPPSTENNTMNDTDLKDTPPKQSVESVPTHSIASVPIQSHTSAPMQSVVSVPMQSVVSVPMQSVVSVPMQSIALVPMLPHTSVPLQSRVPVPTQSIASLATFSDYGRAPPLPIQHPPHVSNSPVYTRQFPPVNIIGHNYMTSMPPNFPYAQHSAVPVVTAADKAAKYILELEEKQEELKMIIMKEQDKNMQLQQESEERYNALQMESAKSLSISDERLHSLCREYAQRKEEDDKHIGSLFIQVEKLRVEIQERENVAAEYETAKFLWHEERTALTNEMQDLLSQLQNAKLSKERSAVIIQEKDGNVSTLTNDLAREREIRALKQAEQAALEAKFTAALSRAQNSEVELLKLKLDVGMQILSRSESDATLFSNMYAKQAKEMEGKNPAVSSSIQAAGAEWHKTAATLKKMKAETENNFKDQISKVQGGQPLNDLPKLALPKPPQPPKTPKFPAVMQPEVRTRQATPPRKLPNEAQPTSALSNVPAPAPVCATAPPGGATQPSANHKALTVIKESSRVVNASPQPPPPVQQAGVRPQASRPMEKIMLALHAKYPTYSRQQFKYYIDELRAKRNGSLTGMKFEDIVNSVSAIIEGNNPSIGRTRVNPLDTFTLPLVSRSNTSSPSSVTIFEEEDDPCIICHDELDTGTILKLACSHRFHKTCIDRWLQNHDTCPTCREPIAINATRRR